MDFTLKIFQKLLESLSRAGFSFQTVEQFISAPAKRVVVLRHDVDLKCMNALMTAKIENRLNIGATYYFRIVKESNKPNIIRQIRELGHEIGYHYEDMSLCKGNPEKALKSFEKNLEYFRGFYPVKTICMHGSPLSGYDNRELWKYCNYKDYGIICEPYFDIDFTQVLYLTDTGRRWDGEKVSVRDKMRASENVSVLRTNPLNQAEKLLNAKYILRSTSDIISMADSEELPDKILLNIHPQRWDDRILPWIKEYMGQNIKNVIKRLFYVK